MSRRRSPSLRYVPCQQLDGQPHVMVDGAPRPGTALTLSHWPMAPTPPRYDADVSAAIVGNALRQPRWMAAGVEVATVDHYDCDGVISLALLVQEGLYDRYGDLLVDAATAGDFDVVRSWEAAAVAFGVVAAGGVEHALQVLPALVAEPERHGHLWGAEMSAYQASLDLLARGAVRIEDHPEVDLAVVEVDCGDPAAADAAWGDGPVHPGVVHSATTCLRVLTVAGGRLDLRFRYETWVRLAGRRPRPRVDLSGLAARLGATEEDGGAWSFDGAGAVTPCLERSDGGPSTIDPARFVDLAMDELRRLDAGPPAWDPYSAQR